VLRLLKEVLVLLDGLQHLSGSDVALLSSSLIGVDVATVLVLNISARQSQSGTFLLSSLLGGKTLFVGCDESILLSLV
jgi:hypothetical protein